MRSIDERRAQVAPSCMMIRCKYSDELGSRYTSWQWLIHTELVIHTELEKLVIQKQMNPSSAPQQTGRTLHSVEERHAQDSCRME